MEKDTSELSKDFEEMIELIGICKSALEARSTSATPGTGRTLSNVAIISACRFIDLKNKMDGMRDRVLEGTDPKHEASDRLPKEKDFETRIILFIGRVADSFNINVEVIENLFPDDLTTRKRIRMATSQPELTPKRNKETPFLEILKRQLSSIEQ